MNQSQLRQTPNNPRGNTATESFLIGKLHTFGMTFSGLEIPRMIQSLNLTKWNIDIQPCFHSI